MKNLKSVVAFLALSTLLLRCTPDLLDDSLWDSLGTSEIFPHQFGASIEVTSTKHYTKLILVAKRCTVNLTGIAVVCTDGFTQNIAHKASLLEGERTDPINLNIGNRVIQSVELRSLDMRNSPATCKEGLVELKGYPQ